MLWSGIQKLATIAELTAAIATVGEHIQPLLG